MPVRSGKKASSNPSLGFGFTKGLLGILLLTGLNGCSTVTIDLAGGGRSIYAPSNQLPPVLTYQYEPSPEKSRFDKRLTVHWIFWTVPLNHPDWYQINRELFENSDAVGDLSIRTETDWGDILVGCLTLGCYRSSHIIISGDRIRFTPAVPPPRLLSKDPTSDQVQTPPAPSPPDQ